jgi:hypothetical protein
MQRKPTKRRKEGKGCEVGCLFTCWGDGKTMNSKFITAVVAQQQKKFSKFKILY